MKRAFSSLFDYPVFKSAFTLLIAVISYVIHDNIIGVGVLVGLVIIDQLSGVWVALKENKFSSGAFRNGIVKLLFYLIIVGAFHSLSKVNPLLFDWMHLDDGALAYLSATEVISIVENSSAILGLPFPSGLLGKLKILSKTDGFKLKKKHRKEH